MKSHTLAALLGTAAMLAAPSLAQAAGYGCPADITTTQRLSASQPGWTAIDAGAYAPNVLTDIIIYDGNPTARSVIRSDSDTLRDGTQVYSFTNPGKNLWMQCRYSNTRVTLNHALPRDARRCVVSYDTERAYGNQWLARRIECDNGLSYNSPRSNPGSETAYTAPTVYGKSIARDYDDTYYNDRTYPADTRSSEYDSNGTMTNQSLANDKYNRNQRPGEVRSNPGSESTYTAPTKYGSSIGDKDAFDNSPAYRRGDYNNYRY